MLKRPLIRLVIEKIKRGKLALGCPKAQATKGSLSFPRMNIKAVLALPDLQIWNPLLTDY